jgi:diaminohydroxyphosphoribosylaminopyrimidine deaminase/5-amino-6-(5-phosphoribosylamino)uracil reductase
MAGIGTVLADDPMLNVRFTGGRSPVRIICDSRLRIPTDCAIARTAREYETIVACAEADPKRREALEQLGIEVLPVDDGNGRVDLGRLCQLLGERNIDSILLEGGGTLNDAMLRQELVQELQVFVAPKIFGGAGAKTPVEGLGVELPSEAVQLHMETVRSVGEDLLIVYRR